MKTLIVLNVMSGNSAAVDIEALKRDYADQTADVVFLRTPQDDYDQEGYDRIIVCGGDGTLNRALNRNGGRKVELYYLACGTLNEKAKAQQGKKKLRRLQAVGQVGGKLFSYVAATGAFTEIGYTPRAETKKKLKVFAYFSKTLKAYRIFNVAAAIKTEKHSYKDVFNLIMILDSPRCFGFNFNRLYKKGQKGFHVLTIKSPKHKGFLGLISMFFTFFRAFFIGFNKEVYTDKIKFFAAEKITLDLEERQAFCVDGEETFFEGEVAVERLKTTAEIFILQNRYRL